MRFLEHGADRSARRYSRTTLVIALSCLTLIAIAGSLTMRRVQFERDTAIANEMKKNSNLAIALEEQTIRTLKAIDQVLLFVRHQYVEKGRQLDIRKLITDGEIDDSTFNDISIIDEHGYRIIGRVDVKPISVKDRDYFKLHLENPGDDFLNVSPPELGRITGKWAIHITRRINKADGSFAGIVIISLDPSYFIRFYQQADLGRDGVVTLVGRDGIARARYAGNRGTFGDDLRASPLMAEQQRRPVGTFLGRGFVDGVPRYCAYRTVRDYPLIVLVGTSQKEALAPFYKYERDYYFFTFAVVTALVAFFASAWIGALSRQRRALSSLSRTETQFRATYNQAAVGIARIALDGRFVQVNPALCLMLGYSEEELLALSVHDVAYADEEDGTESDLAHRLFDASSETPLPETEHRYRRKDGSALWVLTVVTVARDASGQPDYFVGVVQDITKRKELQDRLVYQATFDSLTRLPNRMLFYDRLRQALSLNRRKRRIASVLFVDLDRFKQVNDTFGHEAGDDLLGEVAQRITSRIRLEDTVGRLGGDEFAVILTELALEQDAARVAQKIIDALAFPFQWKGQEVFVTSSIGIAMFPTDSEDPDDLVKHADTAMLRAKALGRNNYQFYSAQMNEFKRERIQMDSDLRRALQRDEFLLHFQPKMSLRTGEITGFEALLRWRHPREGLVLPNEFIPFLEDSGLVAAAGTWVLLNACRQIDAWLRDDVAPVPIAVNISAQQFHREDMCSTVEAALRAHAIDPRLLEVEITETAAMQNADTTVVTLEALRKQGVQVAIDDFGTGYSSLSYLQRFPLTSLKLDRSFVTGLPADVRGVSIALAVITMAHSLGLKVIAEGVETHEQAAFLAEHGCDEIQGYYVSRPLPAEESTAFLKKHRARTTAFTPRGN